MLSVFYHNLCWLIQPEIIFRKIKARQRDGRNAWDALGRTEPRAEGVADGEGDSTCIRCERCRDFRFLAIVHRKEEHEQQRAVCLSVYKYF